MKNKVYKDGEVDFEDLEAAVMRIAEQGLGCCVAVTSYNMAHYVAEEIEGIRGAYYECDHYEKEQPRYPVLEELLKEWFNFLDYKGETYWFEKAKTKSTVLRWLGDDFRGTVENPF